LSTKRLLELDMSDELAFGAVGSVVDQLSATLSGPSPYNGSLPFVVELQVYCTVVDDEFVVTVRNGPDVAARISNVTTFAKEPAICQAVQAVLGIDMPDELPRLTGELANYGYRYIKKESGAVRGHTETVMLMADSISELDAALKLDSEPEFIYDLLDAGADPMRRHIKYGRPFEVARLRAYMRADYEDVVAYMRALGAH
jgi:hypothetical protein